MENIDIINLNLNNNEKYILEKINDIFDLLNKKDKNINEIINKIKELTEDNNENEYLKIFLYPEIYKGVKIENIIPLPTCTFQLHTTKLITPYLNEFRIIFNPFFLYDKTYGTETYYEKYGEKAPLPLTKDSHGFYYTGLTSFYQSAINSVAYKNRFSPITIDQGIPNLYSHYRLITACITIKYIGKLDEISGILGGTIITEENSYIGGFGGYRSRDIQRNMDYFKPYEKYSDYKQFMNSPYHKQYNCIDGIKLIYFPIDNSYEEFVEILKPNNIINYTLGNNNYDFTLKCDKNYKNGFNFYVYGLGLPNINNCLKVDIYCNFECIPNIEYKDSLPLNIYNNNLNIKSKQNIINSIRNKCILKLNNNNNNISNWKDILLDLKRKKIKINYINLYNDINNMVKKNKKNFKKVQYNGIELDEDKEKNKNIDNEENNEIENKETDETKKELEETEETKKELEENKEIEETKKELEENKETKETKKELEENKEESKKETPMNEDEEMTDINEIEKPKEEIKEEFKKEEIKEKPKEEFKEDEIKEEPKKETKMEIEIKELEKK